MASTLEPTVSMESDPPQGLATLTGVQILATGAYAPSNTVGNQDLVELGYDADWIVQRTGIQERRRATEDQATSDLAVVAAENCLQQAGLSPDQLDLILIGTMTPDSRDSPWAIDYRIRVTVDETKNGKTQSDNRQSSEEDFRWSTIFSNEV